ncbi:transglycosylase SLT domain-containing protein [Niveispirillum sp.]|uniref:transglycosylase SLT domain-containing protein n=1 Tax=Niveispirillum sp. TaxID=1917217 RepID=UPI001B3D194A|nr:transglycosylase SLT domain-containing protein [Niveispirillum sp.]MBP7336058.1 transglycosylase SLT domain-containing protein [Niveispirillum sp.]
MTMRQSRVATHSRQDSGLLIAFTFLIGLMLLALPARAGCLDHIVEAEKEMNIPKGILLAVSLVESGGGGTPSPFIMNVRGRVLFPRSEAEAATYLRDNQGNLRGNVYAGCMQLSLAHHKQAFRPVEKIVNPEANVRYAAKYLVSLRRETGSWAAAVTKYNGSSGVKAAAYQCKIKNQLVSLGAGSSADLIMTSGKCDVSNPPSVGPRTRRAFDKHDENTPVG